MALTPERVRRRRPVACLTPEVQVLAHHGYEPDDDDDRRDLPALANRFDLALPAPFDR